MWKEDYYSTSQDEDVRNSFPHCRTTPLVKSLINIHLHIFSFPSILHLQIMSAEQPATKTSRGPAEEVVAKRLKALGKKLVRHFRMGPVIRVD